MRRIIAALKSGFSEKAIYILNHHDHLLSQKEAKKLFDLAFDLDDIRVFRWLSLKSRHRFDLNDFNILNVQDNAILNIQNNERDIEYFNKAMLADRVNIADAIYSLKFSSLINYDILYFNFVCMNGHTDIAKRLMSDPRIESRLDYNESFKLAHGTRHNIIAKLLLSDKRIDSSYLRDYAIPQASIFKDVEFVKLLLSDTRTDPTFNSNEVMRYSKHPEITKILMSDERVNPFDERNSALINACLLGNTEIVNILLSDKRVDLTINGYYMLESAIYKKNTEIIKLLEDAGFKLKDSNK